MDSLSSQEELRYIEGSSYVAPKSRHESIEDTMARRKKLWTEKRSKMISNMYKVKEDNTQQLDRRIQLHGKRRKVQLDLETMKNRILVMQRACEHKEAQSKNMRSKLRLRKQTENYKDQLVKMKVDQKKRASKSKKRELKMREQERKISFKLNQKQNWRRMKQRQRDQRRVKEVTKKLAMDIKTQRQRDLSEAKEKAISVYNSVKRSSFKVLSHRRNKFKKIQKRLNQDILKELGKISSARSEAFQHLELDNQLSKKLEKVTKKKNKTSKKYFKNFRVSKVRADREMSSPGICNLEPFDRRKSRKDLFEDINNSDNEEDNNGNNSSMEFANYQGSHNSIRPSSNYKISLSSRLQTRPSTAALTKNEYSSRNMEFQI